jgi:cytidyltransferase-like protein
LIIVAFALVGAYPLIRAILFPTVILYPWPEEGKSGDDSKAVIMAGSFNPPHLGHASMIEYLRTRFKHVIVVVGFNPAKSYPVSPKDRAELLRKMFADSQPQNASGDTIASTSVGSIQVEVVGGYIWRFAKEKCLHRPISWLVL